MPKLGSIAAQVYELGKKRVEQNRREQEERRLTFALKLTTYDRLVAAYDKVARENETLRKRVAELEEKNV